MKPITIIFVLFFLSTFALAQDIPGSEGFVKNQIVPDFLNRDIERYYAYDNSGTLLSQPFLFSDLDFSSYELISANVSFTDKNSTQKIVISPLRLIRHDLKAFNFVRNTKLNFAQKDNISTLGVSLSGDNSAPFTNRSKRLANKIVYPSAPVIPDNTDFASFTKVLTDYKRDLNDVISDFDEERLKSVWKYSIGYNLQLFSVFGANGTTDDFDSLNTHSVKSKTISLSLTYSRGGRGGYEITGNYNFINARKEAADANSLQRYNGPSFSLKKRVLKLATQSDLSKSKEYIKSHFIPSIDLGIAFEGKYYKGRDLTQADQDSKATEVVTFFLDFKISPAAQFRIGLPRTWTKKIDDKSESGFGAILQYNFKIVNLE